MNRHVSDRIFKSAAAIAARRYKEHMVVLRQVVMENLALMDLALPADNDEFWHQVRAAWIGFCHEHHLRIPWFLTERIC